MGDLIKAIDRRLKDGSPETLIDESRYRALGLAVLEKVLGKEVGKIYPFLAELGILLDFSKKDLKEDKILDHIISNLIAYMRSEPSSEKLLINPILERSPKLNKKIKLVFLLGQIIDEGLDSKYVKAQIEVLEDLLPPEDKDRLNKVKSYILNYLNNKEAIVERAEYIIEVFPELQESIKLASLLYYPVKVIKEINIEMIGAGKLRLYTPDGILVSETTLKKIDDFLTELTNTIAIYKETMEANYKIDLGIYINSNKDVYFIHPKNFSTFLNKIPNVKLKNYILTGVELSKLLQNVTPYIVFYMNPKIITLLNLILTWKILSYKPTVYYEIDKDKDLIYELLITIDKLVTTKEVYSFEDRKALFRDGLRDPKYTILYDLNTEKLYIPTTILYTFMNISGRYFAELLRKVNTIVRDDIITFWKTSYMIKNKDLKEEFGDIDNIYYFTENEEDTSSQKEKVNVKYIVINIKKLNKVAKAIKTILTISIDDVKSLKDIKKTKDKKEDSESSIYEEIAEGLKDLDTSNN